MKHLQKPNGKLGLEHQYIFLQQEKIVLKPSSHQIRPVPDTFVDSVLFAFEGS